jgi:acylphosphatase
MANNTEVSQLRKKKEEAEPHTAILALVRGRVQGVGFRYEARSMARSLGLTGWVMNLDDGGVETWAEGPASAVKRYSNWLHQGPSGARVDSVDISEREPKRSWNSFVVEV